MLDPRALSDHSLHNNQQETIKEPSSNSVELLSALFHQSPIINDSLYVYMILSASQYSIKPRIFHMAKAQETFV